MPQLPDVSACRKTTHLRSQSKEKEDKFVEIFGFKDTDTHCSQLEKSHSKKTKHNKERKIWSRIVMMFLTH